MQMCIIFEVSTKRQDLIKCKSPYSVKLNLYLFLSFQAFFRL